MEWPKNISNLWFENRGECSGVLPPVRRQNQRRPVENGNHLTAQFNFGRLKPSSFQVFERAGTLFPARSPYRSVRLNIFISPLFRESDLPPRRIRLLPVRMCPGCLKNSLWFPHPITIPQVPKLSACVGPLTSASRSVP